VASAPAPWKRIAWIVVSLFVAHVIASYVCMLFTVNHVADRSQLMPIGRYSKIGAPIRVFRILEQWRHLALETQKSGVTIDSPQGIAFLWFCYLAPLAVIFVALLLAPKYLFVEDDKRRGRRY
jgi:hypothetical protein